MTYIRERWKEPLAAFTKECMLDSRVKPRILDDSYDSPNLPDDAAWKCQIRCYGEKLKMLNATGGVDAQRWSDLFEYLDLPLAQKCAEIQESDVCEKAFLMVQCVEDELSKRYPP
ncbi:hypothetical protein ILUMI_08512 [Ignelater luminosus]|uniref:Uncharacterized protein n=1 Tax=Ignelater luminosus TaxID=2038154 RepID=A0A8K0D6R5_IGNLU|nr:hypothetical protein ILUMI_08512 [Ignelater luminosus]